MSKFNLSLYLSYVKCSQQCVDGWSSGGNSVPHSHLGIQADKTLCHLQPIASEISVGINVHWQEKKATEEKVYQLCNHFYQEVTSLFSPYPLLRVVQCGFICHKTAGKCSS